MMKILYFISLIILFTSCKSIQVQKNYVSEMYEYKIFKTRKKHKIIVSGIARHKDTSNFYPSFFIKVNDKAEPVIKIDLESGKFDFQLKRGKYFFRSLGIGLESIITKEIQLVRGDSLRLFFYHNYDESPIICK